MVQTARAPKTDDEAHLRAAVKQAAASLDAGRSVPYEDVRRWMLSWGTDKELPEPKCR
jgi:predicted transcriptional regulator